MCRDKIFMTLLWRMSIVLAVLTSSCLVFVSCDCNMSTDLGNCNAILNASELPVAMSMGSSLVIKADVAPGKNAQFWRLILHRNDMLIITYDGFKANWTRECSTDKINVAYSHSDIGGLHHFIFQIKNLSVALNGSSVTLFCDSCDPSCIEELGTLTVQGCTNNTSSDVFVSTLTSSPGFRDIGTFQCARHNGQVLYQNESRAISTWCNEKAEWENGDEVQCYYNPTVTFVNLTLNNGSKFHVLDICNVNAGYPKESNTTLKIANQSGSMEITNETFITPNYHGLKAYCFTTNGFGNDTDNSTLDVTFGPWNVVPQFLCRNAAFLGTSGYSVEFLLQFTANPAQGILLISGLIPGITLRYSCKIKEINVNCTVLLDNVTNNDSIVVKYQQRAFGNTTLGVWNITEQCLIESEPAIVVSTTLVQQSSITTIASSVHRPGEEGNVGSLPIIIAAAVGGVLIIAIIVVIALFCHRRRKSGRHEVLPANIATADSSFSKMQDNGERLEQTNIIYDTADLKSGGGTKEVVENELYGNAVNAANYDYKTKKKEGTTKRNTDSRHTMYSTVEKPGNKKKKGEDSGASTSGLQTEGAYAVLDKKKKGKTRAEKNSGSENAGFSGDLQEDATYAVVDKKNKAKGKGEATYAAVDKKNKKETKNKEDATYAVVDKKTKKEGKGKEDSTYAVLDKKNKKNGKGKGNDGPSTSGLVEDCTYAEVKKDQKKPKKDGDDGDLHGSSK